MRRAMGAVVVVAVVAGAHWCAPPDAPRDTPGLSVPAPVTAPVRRVAPAPAPADSSTRRARAPGTVPADFRLDPLAFLSRAPADSLDLLPGVGPVLANRIVDARRGRGSFTSWDDVLAVRGIGPKTVDRWKALAGTPRG